MKVRQVEPAALAEIVPLMEADGFDAHGDGLWYAAYDGDRIVGTARARTLAGVTLIDDVWVHPEHRGRGFGTALMRHVSTQQPDTWLICDRENVGFYEAHGYLGVTELPEALAAHWGRIGDWPSPADHEHVPMRRLT